MKTLMFSLLLVVSLVCGTDTSFACTCAPARSAAQELERATAVFSGEVIEIRRHRQAADIFAGVEVMFRVERVWKGVESRTVSVFTAQSSATCGYSFREGRTYLVYAHGNAEGRLSASICSRTRRLRDARADLEELGAGREMAGDAARGQGRDTSSAASNDRLQTDAAIGSLSSSSPPDHAVLARGAAESTLYTV